MIAIVCLSSRVTGDWILQITGKTSIIQALPGAFCSMLCSQGIYRLRCCIMQTQGAAGFSPTRMSCRGPERGNCARVTSAVVHILDGKAALVAGTGDVPDGQRWHLQPGGGRFDQWWELCSCILENPAAVRTSGDIMGWGSSKGEGVQKRPRKSLRCSFWRKVRENIEENPKSVLQKLSHANQLPGQAETGFPCWKSTDMESRGRQQRTLHQEGAAHGASARLSN